MNVWSSWLFRRGYKFKGVRLITLYSMNLVKLGTWLRWSTCDNECYQELSSMLHTLSYLALINNCDSVTCYPRQVIYSNQFTACVHQCLTTKWARTLLHVWTKVTFFFVFTSKPQFQKAEYIMHANTGGLCTFNVPTSKTQFQKVFSVLLVSCMAL